MGWGGLYDEVDGGFFRYVERRRDWQTPHSEKMLETNAALLRLYLDAGAALGHGALHANVRADVLRYIQTWLADPVDGGWWGSQRADAKYYAAASPDERRALRPRRSVRVLYADANAAMVSAALQAARRVRRRRPAGFRVEVVRARPARVLQAGGRRGALVRRPSRRVAGCWRTSSTMAAASLDAFELTGNIVYEMMAEELAHYAVRTDVGRCGRRIFRSRRRSGRPSGSCAAA